MDKRTYKLLNTQITKELESAYLYLGFANYFAEKALGGFAHWYRIQAQEEIEHALKFVDYLNSNNLHVTLDTIAVLDTAFENDMEVLSKGLKHEKKITELINAIYASAQNDDDYRTIRFLDWFIDEQAEEETNAQELIDKYNLCVCDCGCGLSELNKELAERKG